MTQITRRTMLRGTAGAFAAGTLGFPYVANAAAVTATVWYGQGFIPDEDTALRKMVADYEKQSTNKIDLSIVPFAPLRQKEVSAITSGVVPDVMEDQDFDFSPLNSWADKLEDLSDIIEINKSDYSPLALTLRHYYNNVAKKRSYYAIPQKLAAVPFHIWKSLVEKGGGKVADIPTKWDDFLNYFKPLQAKLREQGMRHTYSFGWEVSTIGVDPLNTFYAFNIAYGGKDIITPDGKFHGDDPQVKEAIIKALGRLSSDFKGGFVPPGVVNWNDADDNNAFHSKLCIMDFDGSLSTELALIKQKDQYDDILTHGLPLNNEGQQMPAQVGVFGPVIPKGAKNLAVGKEFIKYSMQPKVLNEYLKGGLGRWAIPYPEVVKNDPFWLKSDPHRTVFINETVIGPTIPIYEAYSPAVAQLNSEHVFNVAWADITSNGMQPAAAVEKALKRAGEIFAKYPIQQS